MKKLMSSKTRTKLRSLVAKMDKQAAELVAKEKLNAKDIDAVSGEIKRLYNGIKAVATKNKESFKALQEDDKLIEAIEDLAIIATRLDLLKSVTAEDEDDEILPDDEISTDDVLEEMGVGVEQDPEGELGGDDEIGDDITNEPNEENEVDVENDEDDDENDEDDEGDITGSVEPEFKAEGVTAKQDTIKAKKSNVTAKRNTVKAKRAVTKRVSTVASTGRTPLFDFIGAK